MVVGVGGITTENLRIVSGRHWSYQHPDYRLGNLRGICVIMGSECILCSEPA